MRFFYQSITSSTIACCSVEVLRRYMRVVSILSCPIRSARNAMSLQRSKKLFAKRWRKECGYTTAGSMPYRTANFFSCPEIPLVVILSPYLFKKMKPYNLLHEPQSLPQPVRLPCYNLFRLHNWHYWPSRQFYCPRPNSSRHSPF